MQQDYKIQEWYKIRYRKHKNKPSRGVRFRKVINK